MGTSQSHTPHQHQRQVFPAGHGDVSGHPARKTPSPQGKPSPPSQAQISDVTHSSVALSWQPPRHNSGSTVFAYTIEVTSPTEPKAWTVVTKSCQGNSYQVKHLIPNSQYIFRVRAENIHGLSKGSRPTEVVETNMFGMDQERYVAAPEDRACSVPRRQHTINLHLEGAVTSILNHTDIHVVSKEARVRSDSDSMAVLNNETDAGGSSDVLESEDEASGEGRRRASSLQTDTSGRSSLQPNRTSNSLQRDDHTRGSFQADRLRSPSLQRDANTRGSFQPERLRSYSLQREANQRSSLQPSRKRSLPILLPGTRTDSLNKLRESQTFPVSTKPRWNEATDMLKKREQRWRDRSASDAQSTGSGSQEDIIDGKKYSSKEESSTDSDVKPTKRDSGLEEDPENPWEKDDSVSEVSDRIMSASLSDDVKMELYSHSMLDTTTPGMGINLHRVVSPGGEGGPADFRTLRNLLHSDDIIVKPARSLPDVVAVGKKSCPNHALSTIVDLEEDEESVRITTL